MAVKAILDQGKLMRTIVEAMVSVSDDVAIEISNLGFRAQAIDMGKALVVDAFLSNSVFSEIKAEPSSVFHVDLDDFTDFVKTAKSDDALVVEDNVASGTLDLRLQSDEMTKRIALRLNDVVNYKFMKIIDRPFFSECNLDAGLFADAIKAAELGDEHVKLTHTGEKLHFTAASNTRTAEATIHYEGNDKVTDINFKTGTYDSRSGEKLDIPETHTATFGLKYLKRIARIGRSGSIFKISMSDKQPLRIVYPIDEESGYIAFAVAPRLLEDER
ncbi:MAG: hypothetical protein ACXAB7_24185 [Candidatus Kariarchaeaceae archaeon]|jgi:proliferating cell nuclear antigen